MHIFAYVHMRTRKHLLFRSGLLFVWRRDRKSYFVEFTAIILHHFAQMRKHVYGLLARRNDAVFAADSVRVRVEIARSKVLAVQRAENFGIHYAVYFSAVRRFENVFSVLFFVRLPYHFYDHVLRALKVNLSSPRNGGRSNIE